MPIYINKADRNLMVHFGYGDLLVGCANEDSEIGIHPAPKLYTVGASVHEYAGITTADIPPGVRLIFDHPDSIRVLIEALEGILKRDYADAHEEVGSRTPPDC